MTDKHSHLVRLTNLNLAQWLLRTGRSPVGKEIMNATLKDLELAKEAFFATNSAFHQAVSDINYNEANRLEELMNTQWNQINLIIKRIGNN